MKPNIYRFLGYLLLLALLAGCAGADNRGAQTPVDSPAVETPAGAAETAAPQDANGEPATLNVMVHDSFAASEEVVRQFEEENNVTLNFVLSGDAGSALNRAVLSKGAPLADVFYGVDNTFLSRALKEEIFEPYDSPLLEDIRDDLKLDPQNRALPVDYGDVCINYDKAYFTENELAVPQSLEDLTRPEYKGLLVVENPATSSPGLAFLMATIAQFGEEGYLDYWTALRENDVVVANDWEAAYYTNFSGSSGQGPQPMVVSYSSSPVAEVVFATEELSEAPTGSIVAPGTCFRQVEFVGILAGTNQRALAEKFVDFMLSPTFQEDIPLQMFVFPANEKAELPEPYQQFAEQPESPASLDPELIAQNREAWIQAWSEVVLR